MVNVHYLADLIEGHLGRRAGGPAIQVSDERAALLETGGGIRKALPLLGDSAVRGAELGFVLARGTGPQSRAG